MQLETYLLFDSPLLISSSSSSSCILFSILFFLFSFLFWFLFFYIHPLPYCQTEKHSPQHNFVEYNINITYLFLSPTLDFFILVQLPLLDPLLPHLSNEKGSTEYDLKTFHVGNTIETTVIAMLESCLRVVAINCVILFHTYLLVPCQVCSLLCFPQDHLHLHLHISYPSLLF